MIAGHYKSLFWVFHLGAVLFLVAFLGWAFVAASTLYLCYGPLENEAKPAITEVAADGGESPVKQAGGSEAKGIVHGLADWFTGDSSGASAICVGLFLLAVARYLYMRGVLEAQKAYLSNSEWAKVSLPDSDALASFSKTRSKKAGVLERRLLRQFNLHSSVTPLVTAGLFGTLAGLHVGFVRTLGAGGSGDLEHALQSAVVVVATAALSSITGIGLGQLLVERLACDLDSRVEVLLETVVEG